MSNKTKIICVVGPTASGKTSLGVDIAIKNNGEIVSADSMQIYRGIHIASAAPDSEEMRGVPHHLIEFLDVGSAFTVADYVKKARECISDICSRGKTPVIVGGTGLYVDSLVNNIIFAEEEQDTALRCELEQRYENEGAEKMLKELSKFDPESAARLHGNNKRRIIRAFEVYMKTGITFSKQCELSKQTESPYDALMIGIDFKNRENLYKRINDRVELMLSIGLLKEAETTLKNMCGSGAMQAIGHKEIHGYLNGDYSLDEAKEKLKQSTRRYAKRQLTWFRRNKNINWIYADETPDVSQEAQRYINNFL